MSKGSQDDRGDGKTNQELRHLSATKAGAHSDANLPRRPHRELAIGENDTNGED